jgi:signal transduction histidine kinase
LGNGNPVRLSLMNGTTVALLGATLDSLDLKIAVLDPSGRIVLLNQAWRAGANDSIGVCRCRTGESFLSAIEQSSLRSVDVLRLLRGVRDVLACRRLTFSFQCKHSIPSSPAWFSIQVESLDAGGSMHARIQIKEITMVKLTERSRTASEQRIRRIKEKMKGQERVITTLRERERLKDEFIAVLAHELRSPLAPIMTCAEVLSSGRTDQQISVRACEVIRRQGRMLVHLVDDLLDIARVVRGNVELRKEPVDLRAVVATAMETARPLIDQHGHTLRTHVLKRPLVVEGDAWRLAQIVSNLLNNAAKYTMPGGRITLVVARVGDAAILRVRDTGIGISQEQLSRVFELFAQAEPRSKQSLGGLGVGLALARMLAERHGGALTGHSEGPGCGSEFTLALPLAPLHSQAQPAASLFHEKRTALHRRILIVEDDVDTADSMAALLRLWGHEVAIARDGSVGVSEAITMQPDFILVDIGLPTIDGYEVAEAVHHHPQTASIPLIAVSGFGRDVDRERSARAGFCMHLVKPVDPQILSEVLQ